MKLLMIKIGVVVIILFLNASCSVDRVMPAPEFSTSPVSPVRPGSPLTTPTLIVEQVQFSIDQPLLAGARMVSGSGPSGIPIQVVDITTGGKVLGSGSIDRSGRYEIEIASPIEPRHLIGIQLGQAKNSATWEALWKLRGENARAIPQIGDFFDTSLSLSE